MTAAEFRTLREGLGLSQSDCARLLTPPVAIRTIRYWESDGRGVPDGAASELLALEAAVSHETAKMLDAVLKSSLGGPHGQPIVLTRHLGFADFPDDLCTIYRHPRVYNAMIGRVWRELLELKVPCRLISVGAGD